MAKIVPPMNFGLVEDGQLKRTYPVAEAEIPKYRFLQIRSTHRAKLLVS
jgi:hypothetical protein